jgi:hypothetical protein
MQPLQTTPTTKYKIQNQANKHKHKNPFKILNSSSNQLMLPHAAQSPISFSSLHEFLLNLLSQFLSCADLQQRKSMWVVLAAQNW